MTDFFSLHANLITTLICMVLLGAIYFANQYKINLWWLSFYYSLPVVGKIARISKDNTRYAKDKAWTNSERTLCEDYNQFLKHIDEAELRKRLLYLSKAGDIGRTQLPIWLGAVLAILLIAEGLGFSYLLGTWMAGESGSENTRTLLMYAIVFVLCIVLMFVTHSAGHQLYRTNLIKQSEKEWRESGQDGKFRSANVLLDSDQTLDDNMPHYTQCVNRVGTSGSYVLVIIAVVMIAIIATASTWMRVKHLESELVNDTTQTTATSSQNGNPFGNNNMPLPQEITKPQAEADQKGVADGSNAHKDEGLAAFIMLAFIFVITQIVGIAAGYKWGFAGKESKAAYKGTSGFSTYDDYKAFYTPVARTAQAKLQSLQQRVKGSNIGLELTKSFEDYLEELRHSKTAVGTPSVAKKETPRATEREITIEEVLKRFDELGDDPTAATAYLKSLPAQLKAQAVPLIKEKMEKKESQRLDSQNSQHDQAIDDLFAKGNS